MDISFRNELESSAFFAGVPDAKICTSTALAQSSTASSPTNPHSGSSRPSSMFSMSASSYASCLRKQHQHIRALERELERCEVAVEDAIRETFRAREREAALGRRVGEMEAMLGATARPTAGIGARVDGGRGMGGGVDREHDEDLREKFNAVVRERDEGLRLLAEVRKVMYLVGATG
jgi:hypothetical protein